MWFYWENSIFQVWRGNSIFCFGGKTRFYKKFNFAVLAEKHDFTVLAGNLDFVVAAEKFNFAVLAGILDFKVLVENLIIRF